MFHNAATRLCTPGTDSPSRSLAIANTSRLVRDQVPCALQAHLNKWSGSFRARCPAVPIEWNFRETSRYQWRWPAKFRKKNMVVCTKLCPVTASTPVALRCCSRCAFVFVQCLRWTFAEQKQTIYRFVFCARIQIRAHAWPVCPNQIVPSFFQVSKRNVTKPAHN